MIDPQFPGMDSRDGFLQQRRVEFGIDNSRQPFIDQLLQFADRGKRLGRVPDEEDFPAAAGPPAEACRIADYQVDRRGTDGCFRGGNFAGHGRPGRIHSLFEQPTQPFRIDIDPITDQHPDRHTASVGEDEFGAP